MKEIALRICFQCACLVCACLGQPAYASEAVASSKRDSLLHVLSLLEKPADKLPVLRDLAYLVRQAPEEVAYLHQLLAVADETGAVEDCYHVFFSLGRYYGNEGCLDSLLLYTGKLDSLAKQRDEVPEALFDIHNVLCRYYLIQNDYGLAMNEAVKQQLLVAKSNNKMGMISCNENLGLNYMLTRRYPEAIAALESCISLLKEVGSEPAYELQVAECLVRCYWCENEFGKAEALLVDYEKALQKIEASNDLKMLSFPTRRSRFMLYSFQVLIYSMAGDREKAEKAIQLQSLYEEEYETVYDAEDMFNLSMAHYSMLKKEPGKALGYLDAMLRLDYSAEGLAFKIQILKGMGRAKEALAASGELLGLEKQIHETAYLRQVDQLSSLQQSDRKEKESQSLQIQEAELKNQHSRMTVLVVFFIILLIVLFFLIYDIIHSKKLKNALLEEQKALIDINENLRVATVKAEKSEHLKRDFIANLSHEIRIPLNTIVGASGLLTASTSEERSRSIEVINENSDLLLSLVDDVLNLSQLERDGALSQLEEDRYKF